MTYDLAVWEGELPLDNAEAGSVYDELYERYLESEDPAVPPSARIEEYVTALTEPYPEESRVGYRSPWTSSPLIDEW